MLSTGLVSITFRKLRADDIITLAKTAQVDSIEWGGDIHVPHGDISTAKKVRRMTARAGLSISAYGSYYRLAASEGLPFGTVLDTAEALGAPIVRVWAGNVPSVEIDREHFQAVTNDARHVAALAQNRGIQVGLEYHANTLTDTLDSTLQLLHSVDQENLFTFWQPLFNRNLRTKYHELRTLLPQLANLHVFHWNRKGNVRHLLADGSSDWHRYLEILRASPNNHTLSLEFAKDDDESNFLSDAKTLNSWLKS